MKLKSKIMKSFLSKHKPSAIFWNVLVILAILVPVIFDLRVFIVLQAIASCMAFFFIFDGVSEPSFRKMENNNFWMNFTVLYLISLFIFFMFGLGEKAIKAFNNWLNSLFIKK